MLWSLLFTSLVYAQPANDVCSGAITLNIGLNCNNILVTLDGTETDSGVPDPGCASYNGGDLWYKLVMPASGEIRVETDTDDGSISDGGMAIYTGADCNNLILYQCNDDGNGSSADAFERILVTQPAGTTIYIRVWEYGGTGPGTFNICAYEFTPPPPDANDDCVDAIELTVDAVCTAVIGTNSGATDSEAADATIPDPGCADYLGGDVWFKFIVPASGDVAIETYEDDLSMTDGGMAIYSGTCDPNGLTLVSCDDDGGVITSEAFERIELLGQTPGEILFVRVWAFGNDQVGTFNICATELNTTPPANDDCVDAIELTVGAACTAAIGTNSGATNSEVADATIPDPGCGNYLGGDVWFKFVVPASGDVAIETYEDDSSITDGGMAVYSGICDPNGLTLLSCDDDGGVITNEAFERIELLGQTPGDILLVRVWAFDNAEVGTFNICATEFNPLSVTNEELNTFSMYPNPAKNFVNFNSTMNNTLSIKVYDVQGKLILVENNFKVNRSSQLDVSNLKSGVYFVKADDGNNQIVKKLLIK